MSWLDDAKSLMGDALDLATEREKRRFVEAENQQREILNEVEQKTPTAVKEVGAPTSQAAPIVAGVSNKTLMLAGGGVLAILLIVAVVK